MAQRTLAAVGVALPGLVKDGVVEEAPNLPQLKGARIQELVTDELRSHGIEAPVTVLNDADGWPLVSPRHTASSTA